MDAAATAISLLTAAFDFGFWVKGKVDDYQSFKNELTAVCVRLDCLEKFMKQIKLSDEEFGAVKRYCNFISDEAKRHHSGLWDIEKRSKKGGFEGWKAAATKTMKVSGWIKELQDYSTKIDTFLDYMKAGQLNKLDATTEAILDVNRDILAQITSFHNDAERAFAESLNANLTNIIPNNEARLWWIRYIIINPRNELEKFIPRNIFMNMQKRTFHEKLEEKVFQPRRQLGEENEVLFDQILEKGDECLKDKISELFGDEQVISIWEYGNMTQYDDIHLSVMDSLEEILESDPETSESFGFGFSDDELKKVEDVCQGYLERRKTSVVASVGHPEEDPRVLCRSLITVKKDDKRTKWGKKLYAFTLLISVPAGKEGAIARVDYKLDPTFRHSNITRSEYPFKYDTAKAWGEFTVYLSIRSASNERIKIAHPLRFPPHGVDERTTHVDFHVMDTKVGESSVGKMKG